MRVLSEHWPAALPPAEHAEYRRRDPEASVLHEVMRENLEPLLARLEEADRPLPSFVVRELRAYVRCGVLARGFTRWRCPACGDSLLVGLSCGGRTVCPSCSGRRMAQTAANLVDHVLPRGVPYRQWVLTYEETIKDTVHMLEYYGDVIAMRHFKQGAPAEAARWSTVPIINCGDGWGEHPTQVLTDLYTIYKELGTLDGINIMCIGDMRMRTMHSIAYAMSQFDIKGTFISPPEMSLTDEFKAEIIGLGVQFSEVESAEDAIGDADVIYMEPVVQPDYTQSRQEATDDKGLTPKQYRVTKELLLEKGQPHSIVLHSLPRMDELPADVDQTRHARYWIEAFNGVVMRMALLSLVMGAME